MKHKSITRKLFMAVLVMSILLSNMQGISASAFEKATDDEIARYQEAEHTKKDTDSKRTDNPTFKERAAKVFDKAITGLQNTALTVILSIAALLLVIGGYAFKYAVIDGRKLVWRKSDHGAVELGDLEEKGNIAEDE